MLEVALTSLPDATIIVDAEEHPTFANEAARLLLDRGLGQTLPGGAWHTLLRLRRPDGQPMPAEESPSRAVLRGEVPPDGEYLIAKPDGSEAAVSVAARPLRDEQGKIVGALLTFHDITEHEHIEAALHMWRRMLQAVLDTIPVRVFWKDRQMKFLGCNLRFARDAGLSSPDEIIGKDDYELPWREQAPLYRADDRQVMDSGVPKLNYEEPQTAPDGTTLWLRTSKIPLRNEAGEIFGVLGTYEDITERKHKEEALRESEERFRSVVEQSQDGITLISGTGEIIEWNHAQERITGLSRDRVIGRPIWDVFFQMMPEELRTAEAHQFAKIRVQDLLRTGGPSWGPQPRETTIQRPDGARRTIQHLIFPIRTTSGFLACSIVRDVTELTELDRLKGQFIETAAHELKTPVTIMKGYAQMLMRSPDCSTPISRRMADGIDRGVDRIAKLVSDLLDISRLQQGHLELTVERIDLTDLVDQVVDRQALMAPKHRIRVTRSEPVVVQGDRDRLEQVLVNLIDNAERYSPKGGDIDLTVGIRDDEAVVSVTDQGVGIPKEKQGYIFQRFYRAHINTPYDYGGMGVGLYISKEIVARHHGRMWFESEEGKGATFYFSLPLRREQTSSKQEQDAHGGQ